VIKFNPQGQVLMTLGRKPEAIRVPTPHADYQLGSGVGVLGDNFNRPTDVAWDAEGNIFVADGYANSRVAKFDKYGKFIKSWGSRGTEAGQFNTLHSIATDVDGNVYVGDRGNRRIQVFDNEGNFKTQFTHIGAPWAICITPGPHQYLYSSNSNGTASMDNGEIYKMELDGTVLGKFGTAGKLIGEFGSVHEIDCRNENELYVGEITNWRVQKLTLRP
jgi:sugar lactone lactonase YvrE